MNEENIQRAKEGKRVNYKFIINNKVNCFSALPLNEDKIEKIVVYCHGLGSNKTWAIRFYEGLLEKNIGFYAYDHPGHGEDNMDFSNFDLSLCIDYLNEVINYIKDKHSKCNIYLFGCSFGGFVSLNRLIQNSADINGTILMCPAINFCEIMEQKSQISYEFFKLNDYKELYNNIKIYYKAYDEFKNGEKNVKNNRFNNVAIIHGNKDKTVSVDNIKHFCEINELDLRIIEGASHEIYGFDNEIVNFIIDHIY